MEVCTGGAWPVTTTSPTVLADLSCAQASAGSAAAMAMVINPVRTNLTPNSLAFAASRAKIQVYFSVRSKTDADGQNLRSRKPDHGGAVARRAADAGRRGRGGGRGQRLGPRHGEDPDHPPPAQEGHRWPS